MDKEDGCIHTMEYYSTMKKNEIMSFAAIQLDLEIIILSKSDIDKCHMPSLIWGDKKNVTKELT